MSREMQCELCLGRETLPIQPTYVTIKSGSVNLVKCRRCGLVYLAPRPDADELKCLYNDAYFIRWYLAEEKRKSEKQYFRELFYRHNLETKAGCKALDVGCGMGTFLEVAQEWNWEAVGIELSGYAARYCKEELHLNVRHDTLHNAGFPNECFDVVTAFDVMEHLDELTMFLAEVKRVLKRNGRLVVLVPNYAGIVFQLGLVLHRLKKTPLPNTPEHLTYFTITSLCQLLQRNGFITRVVATTDANDQGEYLHCHGSILAGVRTLLNLACYQLGKMTNHRESILAVAEKKY